MSDPVDIYIWKDRDGRRGDSHVLADAVRCAETSEEGKKRIAGKGQVWKFDTVTESIERVHPPESPDERYQRVERLASQYAEELERIRPRSCRTCAKATAGDALFAGVCEGCGGRRVERPTAREFSEDDIDVRMVGRPNPGGQHVGTYAGVVAVHVPTGIAVLVDEERSTIKNKGLAVSRLIDLLHQTRPSTPPVAPALTRYEADEVDDLMTWLDGEDFPSPREWPGAARGRLIVAMRKLLAAGKLGDDRRGGGR